MNTTVADVLGFYSAASALCGLSLEATVAHSARVLRRLTKPHFDDFIAVRDATLVRYAKKDDKGAPLREPRGGTILYQFDEDAGQQCARELEDLAAKVVDVGTLPTFRLADLSGSKISGDVLDQLGELLQVDAAAVPRANPS